MRLIVVNCEYIRSIIIQRGGTAIFSIICYQCICAIASRARRQEHRTGVLHCGPVVAGIDIRCKVVRIRGKGRTAPIVRKEDIAVLVVYGSPTLGIIFNQIIPFIFRECTPTGTHVGSPIDKISDIIDGLIAIIDTIVGSGRTPTEQIHRTILRNGSVAVNLAIRYGNTKVIPLVSSEAPSPMFTEVFCRSLQVTFRECDLVTAGINRELTVQSIGRHSAARVQCCKSSLCIEQGLIVAYQQFLVIGQGVVRSARAFNRIARSEFERNRLRDIVDLSDYRISRGLVCCSLEVCVVSLSLREFIHIRIIDEAGVCTQSVHRCAGCINSILASIVERYRRRNSVDKCYCCQSVFQRSRDYGSIVADETNG